MMSAAKAQGARDFAMLWHAPLSDTIAEAVAVLVLCPVLLAVALWNRFPIIFYDTGAYVLQGLGDIFVEERSPVYSLFLWVSGAGESLWLVALLQAVLTAFVVVQTARAIAPKLPIVALVAIFAALDIFTALPWYVGQIQPDCFTAIGVLCIYLLAFHAETLGRTRRTAIWLIAALAIAVHPSHLVLAAGLVLATIAYKAVAITRDASWPNARIRYAAAALLLGVMTVIASNFGYTQKIFVSRAGPVFVFARVLQDGIVMRLLDDTCPQSGYNLCAYKDDLPRTADQWLWGAQSPFLKLHRFEGTTGESERILWASLKRYPLMHLAAATDDSIRQFAMFRTGDQIEPQQWILFSDMDRLIPNQMRAYLTARQQSAGIDFAPLNRLHVPFGWLSMALLLLAFICALWIGASRAAILPGFVLVALIGNAIVCGMLSNPHDRYQSRLIWLAPFALALLAAERPVALRQRAESGT